MAVPIAFKPDTPESEREIQTRLDEAAIQHAAAVLSAYKVLEELHQSGALDILRASLGAGNTIVTKLATAANSKESIAAVRNLVSMSRILGSIDPDVLHSLADELSSRTPKETVAPPPSFWSAVRIFASQDSRRALAGSAAFLQAFGRALAKGKTKR